MPPVNDSQLLMQWVEQRDPDAFREIVNRHATMVYATCRRIVRDAVEAEDIAQECFEALAKAGGRPGAYLGAWLHRVATNRSLQRLRNSTRRVIRETAYMETDTAGEAVEWQEAYALVDEALNALPERLRAPLVLYYLENQTQESIAQTLGVARSTIPYRIGKGLERVRKSLGKRGVTLTSAAFGALGASAKASALPPALAASLGKLAIVGSELIPAATVGTSLLGGMLSLKGALVVTVVVAALGLVGYETVHYQKSNPVPQIEQASPAPSAAPVQARAAAVATPAATAAAPGTANVTGSLLMEGSNAPCKNLALMFESDATGQRLTAHTGTAGRFELPDCPPGSYHVFLDDNARVLKDMPVIVNIPADEHKTEMLFMLAAGASVTGRITDKETGIPVPGAVLSVDRDKDDQSIVSGGSWYEAHTDRDGRYLFEGLQPGKYNVFLKNDITVCDAAGNPQYSMTLSPNKNHGLAVVVTGRERIENIDFAPLLGGAPISGIVRDAGGKPAVGIRVQASLPGDWQEATTKEDGTFTIHGLAAGDDCRLFARTDEEASELIGPLTLPESGLKDVQVQLHRGGVIRGRFTDEHGKPLEGSRLYAVSGRMIDSIGATSGEDGAFQFNALAEGAAEIRLANSASKSAPLAKVDVKWGQTVENVALVYKPTPDAAAGTLQISGHVRDSAGKPVPGVTVDATCFGSNTSVRPLRTDADGYYRIEGLEEGACFVHARHDAYATSDLQEVQAGASNVDFVMEPRVTIEGRIVGAWDGQPVTRFEIYRPNEGPVQIGDADGRFTLSNVDARDTCMLRVRVPGCIEKYENVDLKGNTSIKDVLIRLERASSLSGRVLNADGQPVSGARILLTSNFDRVGQNLTDESAVVARSDADGAFQIESLPLERGFVLARHTEYAVGSAPYRPGVSSVDVVLFGGGTVDGAVTSGGTPAAGVEVEISRPSRSTKEYMLPSCARTDPNGAFRIEQVPPGESEVRVRFDKDVKDPRRMSSITKRITVENGRTLSLTLDLPDTTAGVEGQVRLAGHPATSASVRFTCTKDDVESTSSTQADADGYFKFDAVPAGSGTLRASVRAGVSEISRKVVAPVETVAGQVVRQDLEANDTGVIVADIRGVISSPHTSGFVCVLPGNAPVNSADALLDYQTTGKSVARGTVKNNGPLRFDMLPPGTYTIAVLMVEYSQNSMRIAGMASGVVTVENGAEATVELVLQPVEE
jgi:RNA polymerase sigma factor (sigma-70 family)